ncbi:hypothetical protein BATDEDRAFT_22819 [Batrachochytrium dendrobatidis JAM81]|uniref:Uncharacterized protein n=1 Tax=Batrachochytrium dendrobatidis (strain JAM81 / FGSC 10211) TaxID=684364 RepID=F4NVV8_BATDJ|nr:uncharacterized protein BATDEDRAFT_22819 [Batrachochytrium dendrobatidis JAM81]EGF82374.1 hypothetical protein BATDEDRAFT_22819 [Batrachochytrium dendrobatidis JAM81]|eukprot:XP_006676635.1 hypothetical protein BATDEDRAFT_22819 [Batrachochytrium dendrobatidis JAM81]
MASQKQQVMEAILDSNRQKGQWESLRDNVTKFHKKLVAHAAAMASSSSIPSSSSSLAAGASSTTSALEQLLLGEATLQLIIAKASSQEQIPYDRGPDFIYIPSVQLDSLTLADTIKYLEKTVLLCQNQASIQDLQAIWANQARVLLGQIYFNLGKMHEAIQYYKMAEFPNPLPSSAGSYARTMVVKKWTLMGWTYLRLDKHDLALEAFKNGGDFISLFLPQNEIEKPQEQEPDQWTIWAEKLLFSMSMGLVRTNDAEGARNAIRLYLQVVASTPPSFVSTKKIAMFRQHLLYLFELLPPSDPFSGIPNPDIGLNSSVGMHEQFIVIYNQIKTYLVQYEKMVTTLYNFPRGEDFTPLLKERYGRVLEVYEMWVKAEIAYICQSTEAIPVLMDRYYSLIETLYRATKHTFHSLKIIRYISHTFLFILTMHGDAVCRDERKEAQYVVSTYLFYWEKKSSLILEIERKRMGDQAMHMPATVSNNPESISQRLYGISLTEDVKSVDSQCLTFSSSSSTKSSLVMTDPNGTLLPVKSSLKATSNEMHLALESVVNHVDSQASRISDSSSTSHIQLLDVDGDSPLDAIGVLITGMQMLLITHEGDSEPQLEQAAIYGEKAYNIAIKYAVNLPEYPFVLKSIYQWLGVVYGEQSLETSDHTERHSLQSEAKAMLEKAVAICNTDYILYYQLALQLAEMGESADAVDAINQSIGLKSDFPNAYNLLSLILNAKSQNSRALQVIQEGWRVCVIKYGKLQLINAANVADTNIESSITWDLIPVNIKEDMINLKFTQVALENALYGPRVSIETLHGLFNLLRRAIGIPFGADKSEGLADGTRLNGDSINISEIRSLSHSNSSQSITSQMDTPTRKIHNHMGSNIMSSSTSGFSIPLYRLRTYEMLISLWITTSAVYRELNHFEGARQAVEEAEQLVEQLAKLEQSIGNGTSRILRDQTAVGLMGSHSSVNSVQTTHTGKMRLLKPSKSRRAPSLDSRPITKKWGFASRCVRRILADVSFENKLPVPSKYSKYLSPVAAVEAERKSQLRKDARMPNSQSNASISSSITNSTINQTTDRTISDESVDSLFELEMTIQEGIFNVKSGLTEEMNPVANARVSFIRGDAASTMGPMLSSNKLQANQIPIEPRLSLDQIIKSLHYITMIDPDHLPTRVHLGILYLEKGETAQAEHWLLKACYQAKSRGAGGGRTGVTTVYGGATAIWGWLAWHTLSKVMRFVDRSNDAKHLLFFAMDLEKVQCVRGYECLARFSTSI